MAIICPFSDLLLRSYLLPNSTHTLPFEHKDDDGVREENCYYIFHSMFRYSDIHNPIFRTLTIQPYEADGNEMGDPFGRPSPSLTPNLTPLSCSPDAQDGASTRSTAGGCAQANHPARCACRGCIGGLIYMIINQTALLSDSERRPRLGYRVFSLPPGVLAGVAHPATSPSPFPCQCRCSYSRSDSDQGCNLRLDTSTAGVTRGAGEARGGKG